MSKLKTKWIEDGAVTNAKLNADVAGVGLTGGAGSALAVDFQDDEALTFGTGNDSVIEFDTGQTNDMLLLALDATSRSMVVCEEGDRGFDFAHSAQTNPTVFVHSANQSTSEWLSLAHDQTDGILSAGTGIKITTGNNGDLKLIPNGTGITIFGDAGSSSHTLNTNDDVFISGRLEVDGTSYYDGAVFCDNALRLNDAKQFQLGTDADSIIMFSVAQTQDAALFALDAVSRSLIICEKGDQGFDFAHSAQTNPAVFVHSANQSTSEWLSIAHDQTDGVLSAGTGVKITTGNDGDLKLIPNGTGITIIGDAGSPSNLGSPTNDDFFVSGRLEVDGAAYFDNTTFHNAKVRVLHNYQLTFGSGDNAHFEYDTGQTNNALLLGVCTTSRSLVVHESGDQGFDFAHSVQINPTIFLQSANQSTTEWGSLAHDQTDFVIDAGTGAIKLNRAVKFENYLQLKDITAPGAPGAGLGRLYKKTGNDGLFWMPDAAGPEVDLTSGGVDTSGTPETNDYARFVDADTIEGRSYAEMKTDTGFMTDLVDDTTPQLGGNLDTNQKSIEFDPSPTTNQTGMGLIITATVTTNTQGFGGQLTLNSSWQWVDANAGDYTTMPALATALDSGTGSGKRLLLHGVGIVRDDAWNWSRDVSSRPGFIYVSTTNGDVTQTRPSADGDEVQPVGFPLSADVMMILPCHTLVTLVV